MKKIKVDERGREQIPHWYAISITLNKEKVIRESIQKLIAQETWKTQIFNVVLPRYKEVDEKGKVKEKALYSQIGYVHMILNNETWNELELLRNRGFRGILPGGNPTPLPFHEIEGVFEQIGEGKDGLYLTKEQQEWLDEKERLEEEQERQELQVNETVLYEDENGNKEIALIVEEKENTYTIELSVDGESTTKEVPKKSVYKINQ